MDIGVILLLVALLLGVGLYLAAPLMSNRSKQSPQETPEVSSLMAEHERIITALQELDFDFKLGKIPEEDYPVQRAELLQTGSNVLKKLDDLSLNPGAEDAFQKELQKGVATESRLEQAGTVRQTDRSSRVTTNKSKRIDDDEIESMLAARRKARKSKSDGYCPRCGKSVLNTDLFCTKCGKALK